MTKVSPRLPPGLSLTRASAADNQAILEFMSGQSMEADMSLRFDRSPDYFALHDAHSDDHETWLLCEGEEIVGIASFVQRPAWVDGRIEPVIYMADLRFARRRAAAGLWRSLMRDILRELHARTGARLAWCSILRGNKSGRHAVLRSARPDSTPFEHLCGYSTVSVVARKPWAVNRQNGLTVRRARSEDDSRLRSFVDAQSSQTQFGPVFDESFWVRRLEEWPDFGLDSFYLALDESGNLAGCLAPWDSSAINRIVIEQLPPSANLVRHICNALSPLTRRPRVRTGPEASLPDIVLTHLFVRDRSADVLAALLYAAQRDVFATRRYATLSLCLYDDDPLWKALDDYWYVAVPMDLYWVDVGELAGAGSSRSALSDRDRYAGFESYLV